MITPLPNPDFLAELLRQIDSAKTSVVLVNYLAWIPETQKGKPVSTKRPIDVVSQIAKALVVAKKRGVKVEVVLEGLKLENNYAFYRMLKDAGANVWMDTSATFVHHKVVTIDDKLIFVGSHNLTQAALTDHHEYSIVTDDTATIQRFKEELKKITCQRDDVRESVCRETVALPRGFLRNVVSPLFKACAMSAFDLYLMLYREGGRIEESIPIREKEWSRKLGFDPEKAGKNVSEKYIRYFYKQRINRILGQLKKIGVIEIDRTNDTVACTHFQIETDEPEIEVPLTYWKFGWPARLSFAAKYFWLISAAEISDSPFYPWWSMSLTSIAKKYNLSADIGTSSKDLEEFGILEVLRSIAVKYGDSYSEEAQYYRLNPFYDMKKFGQSVEELEEKYSKGSVAASIQAAGTFWKTHDLRAIESICELIKKFGKPKVLATAGRISKLPNFSALKSLDTFLVWGSE